MIFTPDGKMVNILIHTQSPRMIKFLRFAICWPAIGRKNMNRFFSRQWGKLKSYT